jgi:hypothetical protein
MHYLCLVFRQESDARERDAQVETRAVVEALVESGYDISAFPLAPSGEATTLRRTGDGLLLTEGPVTSGSALLQTVYVVKARDLNDAVRLAAWLPEASSAEIEIRPIVDLPPVPDEPPLLGDSPKESPEPSEQSVSIAG